MTRAGAGGDRRPGLHTGAADRATPARCSRRRRDGSDERRPAQLDRQGPRWAPGAMSSRDDAILVGAVAYHPRIVTIWERFRDYFAERGVPTDYLLYSNYERLVDALLAGDVDIGWNTNTAYVAAEERIGGDAQVLGMRDVDADFRTVIVTRRGETLRPTFARWPGSVSHSAAATPATPPSCRSTTSPGKAWMPRPETTLVRFDTDLGKHGDTGDSELRVVRAVAAGEADAGALGDATWAVLRSEGFPPPPSSRLPGEARPTTTATSPHCPRSTRTGGSAGARRCWRWTTTTRRLRNAMDLEGRQALATRRQVGLRGTDRSDASAGVSRLSVKRVDAGDARARSGPGDARLGPRSRASPSAESSRSRPRREASPSSSPPGRASPATNRSPSRPRAGGGPAIRRPNTPWRRRTGARASFACARGPARPRCT